MRKRTLLLLAMVVLLLLTSAAQAQSPVADQPHATILAGGSYQLITSVRQVNGTLSSDWYQLSPAAPTVGEGCCCKTMLPCIVK